MNKVKQFLDDLMDKRMMEMTPQRVMKALTHEFNQIKFKVTELEKEFTQDDRIRAKELKNAIYFYDKIYLNPVPYFWKLLKENSVKWSEMMSLDLGVRCFEISQSVLMDVQYRYKVDKFWFALKKKLPADVVLIDCEPQIFHYKYSDVANEDKMFCFFGSILWSKVPHGGNIPKLEITFTAEDLD